MFSILHSSTDSHSRRLGEYSKDLSQDEKYAHRLRMVRTKHNKRASKFSLDKEEDLTHFGKKIGEMSKTELRQAFIGSGDEADEPFSYEQLIGKSKEFRAAARRQKMEAEAELDELDDSFKTTFKQLARRDIDQDKQDNAKTTGEDDLAFLARSFQMDHIKKAVAGERSITEAEKKDQENQMLKRSEQDRRAAADDEYDEDEPLGEEGASVVESDVSDNEASDIISEETPIESGLGGLIDSILRNPKSLPSSRSKLIELAQAGNAAEIDEIFKTQLFTPLTAGEPITGKQVLLMKIVTMMFPVSHLRHSIVVPTMKLLEQLCFSEEATVCHLGLLLEFIEDAPKYSPAFLSLAGRLFRLGFQDRVLALTSAYARQFTLESLYGPIQHLFPELLALVSPEDAFVPLKLHHFKPVEVLTLDPAYHEDGTQWTGQHNELKEAKKIERQYKQEKKITAKEMRREAAATETYHAMEKKKEQANQETMRKRYESQMQQAEQNYRLMRTDQGKDDERKMKSNKRRRKA